MVNDDRVEKRATDLHGLWTAHPGSEAYMDAWRRIARAELEREGRLLAGVDDCIGVVSRNMECWNTGHRCKVEMQQHRDRVRAAYEAEFAPPQRTVEQIARDVVMTRATFRCAHSDGHATVSEALLDELAAALKRKDA